MRITNQSKFCAIFVVGSIDLGVLLVIHWDNNMVLLTRKGCCFEVYCCAITIICKRIKEMFLYSGVINRADAIVFCIAICRREVELTFC